ncbi:hypothetical protein GKE73_02880 [Paludibacterium sp. dN 18-1]|uniref:Uncharacterized protein n=1 Tax=Paludibacterium denitrificans TaxID=2675226 RepID=A0A844GAH1_9NEIS|nr:hypothetical protein [Paludibacterium denitrificans]
MIGDDFATLKIKGSALVDKTQPNQVALLRRGDGYQSLTNDRKLRNCGAFIGASMLRKLITLDGGKEVVVRELVVKDVRDLFME